MCGEVRRIYACLSCYFVNSSDPLFVTRLMQSQQRIKRNRQHFLRFPDPTGSWTFSSCPAKTTSDSRSKCLNPMSSPIFSFQFLYSSSSLLAAVLWFSVSPSELLRWMKLGWKYLDHLTLRHPDICADWGRELCGMSPRESACNWVSANMQLSK